MHTLLTRGVLVAAVSIGVAACDGSANQSRTPGAEAPVGESTAAASDGRLNMDQLFPKGEGRDLVLNNCQTCHNFVPILTLQMDAQQWDRNAADHRERVSQLS